jgi:hypothetical protein
MLCVSHKLSVLSTCLLQTGLFAGWKRGIMRWQDIQARFTKIGMGKPIISMVKEASGGGNFQSKGESGCQHDHFASSSNVPQLQLLLCYASCLCQSSSHHTQKRCAGNSQYVRKMLP